MSPVNPGVADQARLVRDEAIIRGLELAVHAVTAGRSLDDALIAILSACSENLGYPYTCFALLDVYDDRIVGRLVSPPGAWRAVQEITADAGVAMDSIVGRRGERRDGQRVVESAAVPPNAIGYGRDAAENAVVQVFTQRASRVVTDLHDILRPQFHPAEAATAQLALGINAIALLPLLTGDRCLGVFAVASGAERRDADLDLTALAIFAAQAALAVENARLNRALRDRELQVSLLLKATIDAQEDERERICLEIHDGVAQTLAPAFHCLQALDSRPGLPEDLRSVVRKTGTLVKNAIREAREVIATLRPAPLDTIGLVATLRYEMGDLQAQTGWRVEFDADQVRFPKAVETALYRIIHEAVNNVTKHAQARNVLVRIKVEQGRIIAEVQDDGVGFDSAALDDQQRRKGVGLLSMRKRAELLQGDFHLASVPGTGTLVRVEVPLLTSGE